MRATSGYGLRWRGQSERDASSSDFFEAPVIFEKHVLKECENFARGIPAERTGWRHLLIHSYFKTEDLRGRGFAVVRAQEGKEDETARIS